MYIERVILNLSNSNVRLPQKSYRLFLKIVDYSHKKIKTISSQRTEYFEYHIEVSEIVLDKINNELHLKNVNCLNSESLNYEEELKELLKSEENMEQIFNQILDQANEIY